MQYRYVYYKMLPKLRVIVAKKPRFETVDENKLWCYGVTDVKRTSVWKYNFADFVIFLFSSIFLLKYCALVIHNEWQAIGLVSNTINSLVESGFNK